MTVPRGSENYTQRTLARPTYVGGKELEDKAWAQKPDSRVQISALPFTHWGTMGKSLKILCLCSTKNRRNGRIYLTGRVGEQSSGSTV